MLQRIIERYDLPSQAVGILSGIERAQSAQQKPSERPAIVGIKRVQQMQEFASWTVGDLDVLRDDLSLLMPNDTHDLLYLDGALLLEKVRLGFTDGRYKDALGSIHLAYSRFARITKELEPTFTEQTLQRVWDEKSAPSETHNYLLSQFAHSQRLFSMTRGFEYRAIFGHDRLAENVLKDAYLGCLDFLSMEGRVIFDDPKKRVRGICDYFENGRGEARNFLPLISKLKQAHGQEQHYPKNLLQ